MTYENEDFFCLVTHDLVIRKKILLKQNPSFNEKINEYFNLYSAVMQINKGVFCESWVFGC